MNGADKGIAHEKIAGGGTEDGKILEVRNLNVHLNTRDGRLHVVQDVSFALGSGETLVTVGESGCGKSMTARALMRLLPDEAVEVPGSSRILYRGRDLLRLTEREMQRVRGRSLAMVFQDPSTSLDPTLTIGEQVEETLLLHTRLRGPERRLRVLEMLHAVGISSPETRMRQYPHELSGGMRQRVMIASALVGTPRVLIADEPTTALDVTTQADILDLIRELQRRFELSVLLVTHDLGVASEVGDRIQVMYAGEILESAPKRELLLRPAHPYTWALLRSVPCPGGSGRPMLYSLSGTPPDLIEDPGARPACPFAPRCDYCMEICTRAAPPELLLPSPESDPERNPEREGHRVRCWLRHPLAPHVAVPEGIRCPKAGRKGATA